MAPSISLAPASSLVTFGLVKCCERAATVPEQQPSSCASDESRVAVGREGGLRGLPSFLLEGVSGFVGGTRATRLLCFAGGLAAVVGVAGSCFTRLCLPFSQSCTGRASFLPVQPRVARNGNLSLFFTI